MSRIDQPNPPEERHERRLRFATPIRHWLAYGAVAGALVGTVFALASGLGDKVRFTFDVTVLLFLVALILRRRAVATSVFLGASAGWALASLGCLLLVSLFG
ncbi:MULTISPECIES: hypothetical protein [unclassified Nocardioides]|uniref:hypothetical protein n=1 Tax=unclassified Nocardioides TaxID=2615069 RepID=UPI0006F7CC4F|nr:MULTISPECIES: hypothetical protein [unclassified Nocardioides]KQY57439.1 hypothetical protein ASD30_14695 [Nocardioides sp. Root140]KQZ76195.1 hypothetical protein ASD66_07970 [Nocardioides sp. Root151]KRF20366.1 hypothetical protein ASH02_21860 [Nocardioides sp. Soil796]